MKLSNREMDQIKSYCTMLIKLHFLKGDEQNKLADDLNNCLDDMSSRQIMLIKDYTDFIDKNINKDNVQNLAKKCLLNMHEIPIKGTLKDYLDNICETIFVEWLDSN